MVPTYHGIERRHHTMETPMERARNAFGWIRDIMGLVALVILPLVAWIWQAQEARILEASKRAEAAQAQLSDFQRWHADTMIRRDYLDARFAEVQAQIGALREEIRAERHGR